MDESAIALRPLSNSVDSAIDDCRKGIQDAIDRKDHRARTQLLGTLASLQLRKAEAERTQKAEDAIQGSKSGDQLSVQFLDECIRKVEEEFQSNPPRSIFQHGVIYVRETAMKRRQ